MRRGLAVGAQSTTQLQNQHVEKLMRNRILMTAVTFAILLSPALSLAADIGQVAPEWKLLQGADSKLHSLSDYKDADIVVVAFLCNKCPCVKGYEARFNRFAKDYQSKGVRFVGINSSIGPIETLDVMKQRSANGALQFDYLRDANQKIGRGFGATSTPHVFILNKERKVVYTGAFDDNRSESQVKNHYVIDAVNAMLAGKPVPVSKTRQFGCAITYQ